ncbi:alpha beta hydrolase domain containing protein [Stylonychia lemnae]|uniref:Alpha beta hydrolase domain containing protein n=1 Tax=Stylonychia lemnae TaxID=5949 RepID=A0A078BAD9_STYLE|nr:alpha beta hydrolase domain containing protein [Stylonychia lemnae]|eukprot:CDW90488.1 alpha beta hydrolase domain containing protein [Stylonychia lemnae]
MNQLMESPCYYATIFLFLSLLICLKKRATQDLVLYAQKGSQHLKPALSNKKFNSMKYRDPFLIFSAPLQIAKHTLLSANKKYRSKYQYLREVFTYPNGGTCAIDWVNEISTKGDQRPLLILTPGLMGDSNAIYIIGSIDVAIKQGYCIVIISQKGSNGLNLTSPDISGITSGWDLQPPIQYIYNKYCVNEKKEKARQIFLFGVSYSGYLISHYLAQFPEDSKVLDAVAIVGSSHQTAASQENMYKYLFGSFDKYMTKKFKGVLSKNVTILKDVTLQKAGIDLEKFLQDKNNKLHQYNELVGKLNGFKDIDDYYINGSMNKTFPKIQNPILYLHSLDDPAIGSKNIDYEECMKNPHILLGTTRTGSHVCHYEGIFSTDMWYSKVCIEFLNSYRNDLK